jgi:hypothetical protein
VWELERETLEILSVVEKEMEELIREVLHANAVGGVIRIGCLLIGVRGTISEYLKIY